MGLDKISVTLYDLLGYLMPGFLLLLAGSLAEATWFGTPFFALARFKNNPVIASIVAYFLGQAAHGIGSWMVARTKFIKTRFGGKEVYKLGKEIDQRVQQVISETFGFEVKSDAPHPLTKAEIYLLADSYIVASGGSVERDILMAREGFFKTSAIAFLALLILCLSGFVIPIKIQMQAGSFIALSRWNIAGVSVLMFWLTLLFIRRFVFFNCVKNNNGLTTFLAMRQKESKAAPKPT
jgi:hypothetical protein